MFARASLKTISAVVTVISSLAAFAIAAPALAQGSDQGGERPRFRISSENSPEHFQTKAIGRFVENLRGNLGDRLDIEFHHSGILYRDRDVVNALRQGKIDMAVPGTWQLDRYVPDVAVFLMPLFYGRDALPTDRVRDGAVGRQIGAALEQELDVAVLGRWIDLGFAHVYGIGRDIRTIADLNGSRVRAAGGDANLERLKVLGATPRVIAWPDLPNALRNGTLDGILTTHETVASAQLWQYGITSVYEDHQYFAQYIPMISGSFWRKMPKDMRLAMTQAWEETVDDARRDAAAAQVQARATLQANGVTIFTPSADDRNKTRLRLHSIQDRLVRDLGLSPDLIPIIAQTLD